MMDLQALSKQFLSFLSRSNVPEIGELSESERSIAIIIQPSHDFLTPLFCITLACLLRRAGVEIHLLWNDGFAEQSCTEQNQEIGKLLSALTRSLHVHRIPERTPTVLEESDLNSLSQLVQLQQFWNSSFTTPHNDPASVGQISSALQQAYQHILSAAASLPCDTFICPDNMNSRSTLFHLAAVKNGKRHLFLQQTAQGAFVTEHPLSAHLAGSPDHFLSLARQYATETEAANALSEEIRPSDTPYLNLALSTTAARDSEIIPWLSGSLEELFEDRELQLLLQYILGTSTSQPALNEPLSPTINDQPQPPSSTGQDSDYTNVFIGESVQIIGRANTAIGENTVVGSHVWLNICQRDEAVRMKIGRCVLIGRQSMISTGGELVLGDYCLLAPRVYISDADHLFEDMRLPIVAQGATLNRKLIVEENCWLGVNACVIGEVTIGRGSVVAAGSIVIRDIPAFSVVVGSPARIVKMYNPKSKAWERVKEPFQIQRILDDREECPLPTRSEYLQTLQEHSPLLEIHPIVAGGPSL